MPKALAIQINWQFAGGTGIMQVEHTEAATVDYLLFYVNVYFWNSLA